MRRCLLFIVFNSILNICIGQSPSIQWAKCLGGTESDQSYSVIQTSDGGFVVAGVTASDDGDVSGLHFVQDMWIVKLDSMGTLVWQRCLGGSWGEEAYDIYETFDKGFIISGYASSTDFDLQGGGFHGGTGWDYWIVKTDSACNIQWQKCFGGSYQDWGRCVIQTMDSNFIVAGWAESIDGDINSSYGGGDAWIVKYDPNGNMVWKKMYGGSGGDQLYSIVELEDSSLIVSGTTTSNDHDVSGNHGDYDMWVLKLSRNGDLIWQKCIGGSSSESVGEVVSRGDRIALLGTSYSNDGDIIGNHGNLDAVVIIIDTSGSIITQRCIGGFGDDGGSSLRVTNDNGVIAALGTGSLDSLIPCNHGVVDFFILKLDSLLNIEWTKCIGGSEADQPLSIIISRDSGLVITGQTLSNDGDVSGHHNPSNSYDIWVVKLAPLGLEITSNENINNFNVHFNESRSLIISLNSQIFGEASIHLFDISGKVLLTEEWELNSGMNLKQLDIALIDRGIYFISLISKYEVVTQKIIIYGN